MTTNTALKRAHEGAVKPLFFACGRNGSHWKW
jgi:hypothetical protein